MKIILFFLLAIWIPNAFGESDHLLVNEAYFQNEKLKGPLWVVFIGYNHPDFQIIGQKGRCKIPDSPDLEPICGISPLAQSPRTIAFFTSDSRHDPKKEGPVKVYADPNSLKQVEILVPKAEGDYLTYESYAQWLGYAHICQHPAVRVKPGATDVFFRKGDLSKKIASCKNAGGYVVEAIQDDTQWAAVTCATSDCSYSGGSDDSDAESETGPPQPAKKKPACEKGFVRLYSEDKSPLFMPVGRCE